MPNTIGLAARQYTLLAMWSKGLTDTQCAARLQISRVAVQNNGWRLRRALNAETRAHAVAIGYDTGLLPTEEQLW